MKNPLFFFIVSLTLVALTFCGAPFIEFNKLHQTHSQFQFNLILNENRNTPIILFQYSENKTDKIIRPIIEEGFKNEPDIAFAIMIDCREFSFDLNKSLSVCKNFDEYQKTYVPKDEQDDGKINDEYFGLDFFSPNPTRIREKGHTITKSHDHQNLRSLNVNINGEYLAKIIRNQVPDLTTYIEDQRDLDDFLQVHSEFRLSKVPKLLYFDQNLQSPLFLKKIAVNLDGWFKVGVSDSPRIAAQYKSSFDKLLLFEYDFQAQKYEVREISYSEADVKRLLKSKAIKSYTQIRKPRDILFDFEHREALIHNVSSLKQVNQLISHGRIILVQISKQDKEFQCSELEEPRQKYEVLFNYACLSRDRAAQLLTIAQIQPKQSWEGQIFFIDGSLKNVKIIDREESLYPQLPQAQARQKITTEKESQMCIEGARATDKEPIFFYFNEKTHSTSLYLMRYFASLEQVNSLLYFCQFLLPESDVVSQFQVAQNTIFTLTHADEKGQSQKVQHSKVEDFSAIKMFLREIGINKIIRTYDQKVVKNQILEITSAEDLTQKCFSHKCIIALIETGTFHQETQIKILKELQIAFSDEPFKYYWIDGTCHFQIGKQLKLVPKGVKFINKSFLFLYNEKTNHYALWKGNKYTTFWVKKDIFRWVKSLRNPENISRVKFGIDFENKKCEKKEVPKEKSSTTQKTSTQESSTVKPEEKREQRKPKQEVNEDEL